MGGRHALGGDVAALELRIAALEAGGGGGSPPDTGPVDGGNPSRVVEGTSVDGGRPGER